MVAGADHDDGGDQRRASRPGRAARGWSCSDGRRAPPTAPSRRAGSGRRPARWSARPCPRGRRVGAPPAGAGVQAEDVDVLAAEQPRRSRREQEVAGQRDQARDHQRPAGRRVVGGALAEQPHQHGQGHHVVGRGVPVAGRHRRPAVVGEPVVERVLPVEVEHPLEVEQVAGAVLGRREVVLGEGAGHAVEEVEGADQRDLAHATSPEELPPGDRRHDRSHAHPVILSKGAPKTHHSYDAPGAPGYSLRSVAAPP